MSNFTEELDKVISRFNYYWSLGNSEQEAALGRLRTTLEEGGDLLGPTQELYRLASYYWSMPNSEQKETLDSLARIVRSQRLGRVDSVHGLIYAEDLPRLDAIAAREGRPTSPAYRA